MELVFLYPKFLLLLFLVPFFIFVYYLSFIYNRKKTMIFSNFEAMKRFYDIEFYSKNFVALYISLMILILAVLTLSGIGISFNAKTGSFSYVIVIDSSESMTASDVAPNRFIAAKEEAKNFIDILPPGVEIGIIGFSGDASVYQGLDSSKIKAKLAIDGIKIGEISGTNVYNALLAANSIFENRQAKAIILISDGQQNIRDVPEIIRYINRNNLMVNTIAVGTTEGGEMRGFEVISKVDEDFLKSLAFNSGGQFFRVKDLDEMRNSFEKIFTETSKDIIVDLSVYCLIIAIVIFTIFWVLYNFRFRTIP